ncbi:MAG: carbohydrate ABC transporter permease [Bacillaceae bacterium]|nr:carbohydrate ABC transporter permease [Bacillaceae bacterium]
MTKKVNKFLLYVFLVIGAFLSFFPLYWMFVMATNPNHVINQIPPAIVPGDKLSENFSNVLNHIDFFGAMLNSLIVSSVTTIGVLFICSLAGFAFAKLHFKGRDKLFLVVLVTMMIPPQLGLIPQYFIITKLGWLNDLKAVIIPGMINAFGIFWMRQYIKEAVPDELIESAKIDGCGLFRTYWNIVVPSILPAFATLGILTFMFMWNDFLWPLTVLKDEEVYTIQIAIRTLQDAYVKDYGMILSGTFWSTLPLIVVFLVFNKLFISSLTQGAVKQ